MEPPGPDLPRHTDPLASPLGTVRLIAGAAAVVVALSGTGPLLAFAVLVALALTTVAGAWATAMVALAVAWRWGTGSLDAVAGAQAVLGPGLLVGPVVAAASTWLAAGALLLGTPGSGARDLASVGPALGVGAVVALACTGGAGGGAVRALATAAAVGVAYVVGMQPWRRERVAAAAITATLAAVLAGI